MLSFNKNFYRLWEPDKLFLYRFNDISIIPRVAQRSRGRYSDYASSETSDRTQRAAASDEDKEVQGKLKVEKRLRY